MTLFQLTSVSVRSFVKSVDCVIQAVMFSGFRCGVDAVTSPLGLSSMAYSSQQPP
jgi:hypothetical protein